MTYRYSTIKRSPLRHYMNEEMMPGHRIVLVKRRDPAIHSDKEFEWQAGCECKWRGGNWHRFKKSAELEYHGHFKEAESQGRLFK